jgi:DNA topoisomerase-2
MLTQNNSPLADVQYGNTDVVVDFKFIFKLAEYPRYKAMNRDDLVKEFKLSSKLSSTNMYLFNAEGRIEKFENIYSIIKYYYFHRLELYVKRREALIAQLRYEMLILRNKAEFIKAVKEGKIDQRKMTEASLLKSLKAEFDADPRSTGTGLTPYEYLIGMSYRSFTNENAQKMLDAVQAKEAELKQIEATTPETMWINDLDSIDTML